MKDRKGQKTITRRGFMKGAAVAGGALAGVACWAVRRESKTASKIRIEEMGPGSRCGRYRIGGGRAVGSR